MAVLTVPGAPRLLHSDGRLNCGASERSRAISIALLTFCVSTPSAATTSPPLVAHVQVREVDLRRARMETVIPGEFDGGFLARVGDIVVEEGGLWVTDNGQTKAFWFRHDGTLKQEYGRRGSGPGEFAMVGDLTVDSLVTIGDPRLGRTVRYRRDGTHVETTPRRTVADPSFALRLGDYRHLRNGAAVGSTLSHIAHRPTNSRPNVHVVVFQPGDATLDTVLTYHAGASGYRISGRSGVFFPPFGPSGAWSVAGDSLVYLANGVSGKVVVLGVDDTTIDTVATIDMGKQGQMITQADLRRTRTRLVEEMDLPDAVELGEMPSRWSVASELVATPNGDIWMRQATNRDRQLWIYVNPASGEKMLATLPSNFHLKAAWDGRLYGVVTDQLGVERIGAMAWRPQSTGLPRLQPLPCLATTPASMKRPEPK